MMAATASSMTLKLVSPGVAPGGTIANASTVTSVYPFFVVPLDRGDFYVTDMWIDSLICPGFSDTTRPTISIGWNRGGTPYSEYFSSQQLNFAGTMSSGTACSSTGTAFTQPAVGASVTVTLAAPAVYSAGTWLFPLDSIVRILRSGRYRVSGFTTTTTTANLTQPAVGSSVTINVASTTDFAVGDFIWISTATVPGAGAYNITAKTATSLTATLNNIGSSFLPGVAAAATIASGSTVTHAQKLTVTLVDDDQANAGTSLASGRAVLPYSDGPVTTTASFTQPTAGGTSATVTVTDNRQFVVGTSAWLTPNASTGQAGFYSITGKTGLDRLQLQLTTAGDYATGATVPSGLRVNVRRQSTAPLALRTFGTSRRGVEPGATLAAYVSVSGNATTANLAQAFVRGYFIS